MDKNKSTTIGDYVYVYDQHSFYECEGIFLDESPNSAFLGDITILIMKVIKEAKKNTLFVGEKRTFPTPRYVPIYIRMLTDNERLLYVQQN